MDSEAFLQFDWKAINGNRFQDLCLDLLACEGYRLQDQGIGPDGGVDAILLQELDLPDDTSRQIRWIAQFKFRANPEATVKPSELGNIENLLARFSAEGFFLVTNGRVTNKALQELRGIKRPGYTVSVWMRRHLERRLWSRRDVARRYFAIPDAPLPSVAVELTVDLPFEDFTERESRLLQYALAQFLEVPLESIKIRGVSKGSTRVLIEVSQHAAELLRDAFEGDYLNLEALGFGPAILAVKIMSLVDESEAAENGVSGLPGAEEVPPSEVTALLDDWSRGDDSALERLTPLVYEDLRRTAAHMLQRESDRELLEPTALVHEVYIRLADRPNPQWQNPEHFFAVAALLMRRLLVDNARRRQATKRGSGMVNVPLDKTIAAGASKVRDLVAIDEALSRLAQVDPRQSRIVELRFFMGFSYEEVAKVLGVSVTTVKREWRSARLWLFRELSR